MEKVVGSNPITRSLERPRPAVFFSTMGTQPGDVAEWLGMGLQNLVHGFESRRRL